MSYAAIETSIKRFAKQFGISQELARECFAQADNNYYKAYDFLLAKMTAQMTAARPANPK